MVNCGVVPVLSTPLFCTASVAARASEKTDVPCPARLDPSAGRDPKYHALSVSGSTRSASPSKLSMYACPAAFACGLLKANSPCSAMREAVALGRNGNRVSSLLTAVASHCMLVVTPATRLPTGSKPSGGRLSAERCCCEMAVKAIWPLSSANCDAKPRMVVGATANNGFSS